MHSGKNRIVNFCQLQKYLNHPIHNLNVQTLSHFILIQYSWLNSRTNFIDFKKIKVWLQLHFSSFDTQNLVEEIVSFPLVYGALRPKHLILPLIRPKKFQALV